MGEVVLQHMRRGTGMFQHNPASWVEFPLEENGINIPSRTLIKMCNEVIDYSSKEKHDLLT